MTSRWTWLAIPIVAALVGALYGAGLAIVLLLGVPWDIGMPTAVRLLGVPLVVTGLAMAAWVIRFRGPVPVLGSTYTTLLKLLRRIPLAAPSGRMEPLVVAGPYRWVRHPLYAGVIALTFGIALLVDRTFAWLGAIALSLWFELVLAPFEERELLVLFGPTYRDYMGRTRRFLPIRRGGRSG